MRQYTNTATNRTYQNIIRQRVVNNSIAGKASQYASIIADLAMLVLVLCHTHVCVYSSHLIVQDQI